MYPACHRFNDPNFKPDIKEWLAKLTHTTHLDLDPTNLIHTRTPDQLKKHFSDASSWLTVAFNKFMMHSGHNDPGADFWDDCESTHSENSTKRVVTYFFYKKWFGTA